MKAFVTKELIDKGWSGDKKYCITTENGEKYLLRVSPVEKRERVKRQFELMKGLHAQGVPTCELIEMGECDEGVYSLQEWIEGEDLENAISALATDKQYALGLEAGKHLKTIHKIPSPDTTELWESYYGKKIDKKIKRYRECSLEFEGAELLIDYINEHRHLLAGRPTTYQHGDYHIGNMMLDKNGALRIIDFDRDDYGDPWEEFNRIVWCAQKSPHLASGLVDGYFDKQVPSEFWELLALYISTNTVSSISWAIPFGEGEIKTMLNQAREVLDWYDNMSTAIPKWYLKK